MGEKFSPAGLLTPEIVIALVGLAVLSLLPVPYKMIAARREKSSGADEAVARSAAE